METPTKTARQILDLFTPEMLQQAATAFWDQSEGPKDVHDSLVAALAQVMRFRPVKLKRLPRAKKIQYLLKHLHHTSLEGVRRELLVCYHFAHQQGLMDDFLAFWGLSHLQGDPNAASTPPPSASQVAAALQQMQSQYRPLDIAVYFATAGLLSPGWHEVLGAHVEELLSVGPTGAAPEPGAAADVRHTGNEEWIDDLSELTAVDHLLIQTLRSRADQSEGAFPHDQLAALVEDFIQLNPERARSYFHRGFLQSLSDQKTAVEWAEETGGQQTWHLAGQMVSLSQQACWRELVTVCDAHPDIVKQLLDAETSCAPVCAAQLFQGLWSVGRKRDAVQAFTPEVLARTGAGLVHLVVDLVETQLAGHAPVEARLLLDQVLEAQETLGEAAFPLGFRARQTLLLARCLRGEQRWEESSVLLRGLLQDQHLAVAEVHLNLGLAAAGIAWLSEVEVPRHRDEAEGMKERLERGRSNFEKAMRDKRCVAAPYALGILDLLDGQPARAASRLETAYARASEEMEAYRPAMLYEKIRLHYGLALLNAFDEPHIPQALELLRTADRSYPLEEWPAWLLEEIVPIADVSEAPACLEMLEWLHQRLPAVTEMHLSDPELLQRSSILRATLARRAGEIEERDPEALWQDNTTLVSVYLASQDLDAASEVLGRLEELALTRPVLREKFVDLLAQPENYRPAWDEEDALHSSAVVWEAAGRSERAYACLRTLFFRWQDQGHWEKAAGLLEEIQDYHLPEALIEEVMRQAPAVAAQTVDEPDAIRTSLEKYCRPGRSIRLLVVGGNEVQAQFDPELQAHFKAEYPGLAVDFEHAPRISSWGRYYDRIKGRVERYDGLVLMRYMRTHMGRSLRALANQLGTPWFPCTGKGKTSIQRTILHAAHALATAER